MHWNREVWDGAVLGSTAYVLTMTLESAAPNLTSSCITVEREELVILCLYRTAVVVAGRAHSRHEACEPSDMLTNCVPTHSALVAIWGSENPADIRVQLRHICTLRKWLYPLSFRTGLGVVGGRR